MISISIYDILHAFFFISSSCGFDFEKKSRFFLENQLVIESSYELIDLHAFLKFKLFFSLDIPIPWPQIAETTTTREPKETTSLATESTTAATKDDLTTKSPTTEAKTTTITSAETTTLLGTTPPSGN